MKILFILYLQRKISHLNLVWNTGILPSLAFSNTGDPFSSIEKSYVLTDILDNEWKLVIFLTISLAQLYWISCNSCGSYGVLDKRMRRIRKTNIIRMKCNLQRFDTNLIQNSNHYI
jgi:hypothetical protein